MAKNVDQPPGERDSGAGSGLGGTGVSPSRAASRKKAAIVVGTVLAVVLVGLAFLS